MNNAAVIEATDAIEKALEAAGIDVLTDDRDLRPGVKFKDVDLVGIPLRVVIGERGLKEGSIEVKWRSEPAAKNLPLAAAAEGILAELAEARASTMPIAASGSPLGPERSLHEPAEPLPRLPYVLLAALTRALLRRAVPDRRRPLGRPELTLAPRPADRMVDDRRRRGRFSSCSSSPA